MVSFRSCLAALALMLGSGIGVLAAEAKAPLQQWLNAQTNIQSWSADFVQTRTLKALNQPLVSHGHVWFVAPNLFRWELGSPAQTIAVRQPEQMLVIYPRLKRAERYPLDAAAAGPWKDALALLEAGFPRTQADLESRFNVLSQESLAPQPVHVITLQPKAASARRMMPQIKIGFNPTTSALLSTELHFADGSVLRNDFTNAVLNPKLEPALFEPKLGPEIKITEPFSSKQP